MRPVLAHDRPVVAQFLADSEAPGADVWIASMWGRWLRGAGSLLAIAAVEGRVVGLSVTTLVSPHEVYLHGFRAHPRHYFLVAYHRLFMFGIGWALNRGRSIARWVINRERFGRFEYGLLGLFEGRVVPAGTFAYWDADPPCLAATTESHRQSTRENSKISGRARIAHTRSGRRTRLTWDDVAKELRLGRVLHEGHARAMCFQAAHGPYLAWAEGTPDALTVCARMFRGYAAARGERPRALLADTPEVATALTRAGFVRCATHAIHETELSAETLRTIGRAFP